MMSDLYNEKTFEREITRIAEQVFSPIIAKDLGFIFNEKERDAVFETDFIVHCMEITVSKQKYKIIKDLDKLEEIVSFYNKKLKGGKVVKGWIITKDDLTADQREILRRYPRQIQHESYHNFLSRLINSQEYLRAREKHPFGSVQDLVKRSSESRKNYFVESFLTRQKQDKKPIKISQVTSWLAKLTKKRILIQGDFGSGKSMHLKNIYLELAKGHIAGRLARFPIYLNLREFAELESPDEALRRHAARIGQESIGEKLVRAWKADYTYLLIDGFDEVVPRATAKETKRTRDLRFQALLIVRRFIKDSPDSTPIVIAGRSNFFASDQELYDALWVDDKWERLLLRDFTEEQANELLAKHGSELKLPSWLPLRPLLISYLVSEEMDKELDDIGNISPSSGWSLLLDKICQREVQQIDTLPLMKGDLIALYGELALLARKRNTKLGPISLNDVLSCYKTLFSDEPSGSSLGQLMRLPCLVNAGQATLDHTSQTPNVADAEAKNFLSYEIVEVASSNLIGNYFKSYDNSSLDSFLGIRSTLTSCGYGKINSFFVTDESKSQKLTDAIAYINERSTRNFAQIDLLFSLMESGEKYTGGHIKIEECEIDEMSLESIEVNYSKISFNNCYIKILNISMDNYIACLPVFHGCLIENFITNGGWEFANKMLQTCDVECQQVENFTSNSYLNLPLPEEVRLLCTVLNKVYIQSKGGRLESALKSGVQPHQIADVLQIVGTLSRNNIIYPTRVGSDKRWHPVPSMMAGVQNFLGDPKLSKISSFL